MEQKRTGKQMGNWRTLLPQTLMDKYEIHNFNHAAEILSQAYEQEFAELIAALDSFSISVSDIFVSGGNKSAIPKKFHIYCVL